MVAIVHVPAPNRVTTAPVDPALAVVFPVTEHTDGVVDEKAITRFDVVDAEIPKAAPPKVMFVNGPKVIACDVRLILKEDEVTLRVPSENVNVKLPPALFTARPVKVATPATATFVAFASTADDEPVARVAVIVGVSLVRTLPAESTTRTTGWVGNATPIATPPTGCVVIDSADAAPTVSVTARSAVGQSAPALNRMVYAPTGPVIIKPENVATPETSVDCVKVPPKVFDPGLATIEAVTEIPAPAGVAPASVTVGEIENVEPEACVVLAVLNVEVLTTNEVDAVDAGLAASRAV